MATRGIYRIRGRGETAYVYKHWDNHPSSAADYLMKAGLDRRPLEYSSASDMANEMVDRVNRSMKEQHDRMARDMAANGQEIGPFHPDCSISTRHEWDRFAHGYMYDVDLGRGGGGPTPVTVTAVHTSGTKRRRAKAHVKAEVGEFEDDERDPIEWFAG